MHSEFNHRTTETPTGSHYGKRGYCGLGWSLQRGCDYSNPKAGLYASPVIKGQSHKHPRSSSLFPYNTATKKRLVTEGEAANGLAIFWLWASHFILRERHLQRRSACGFHHHPISLPHQVSLPGPIFRAQAQHSTQDTSLSHPAVTC